jgi:hypothetical protein
VRAAYRAIFVAGVAGVLSGCAARDPLVSNAVTAPAGNWRVERQTDRITGAPIASALLMAQASNSAAPFTKPVMLQLTCFRNAPLVRLAFEFKVGATRSSVFGYRFDEKPGHEIEARFINAFKTVVIEERADVTPFLAELSASKLLYVRIRSLSSGRTTAEFQLAGADDAVKSALAPCLAAGVKLGAPAPRGRTSGKLRGKTSGGEDDED